MTVMSRYYHAGGLLDLLLSGREFDATDPRDKVYSVLGLGRVPTETGISVRPAVPGKRRDEKFPVDYAKSVSEVYQDTVKFFINRDRNLDILTVLLSHRSGTPKADLPSWALDWTVATSEIPLLSDWDSGFVFRKLCAGGLETEAPLQSYEDLGVLRTQGYFIDVIERAADYTSTVDHMLSVIPGYTFPGVPGYENEEPSESIGVVSFDPARHRTRCFHLSGGDICLGPAEARQGDGIVALLGGKPLFVVRVVDAIDGQIGGENASAGRPEPGWTKHWQLVGPCIVPELMFGDVVASARRHGDDPKDYVFV